MSSPMSEIYRESIRRALMYRAGNALDASVVAEATINICRQMAIWLTPVIGVRGVNVLFSRALHLTNIIFPRLIVAGDAQGDNVALLQSLKAHLAGSQTRDAIEESYAMLVTFTELLTNLIGESLTERLLRPVWELPPLKSEQGTQLWTTK